MYTRITDETDEQAVKRIVVDPINQWPDDKHMLHLSFSRLTHYCELKRNENPHLYLQTAKRAKCIREDSSGALYCRFNMPNKSREVPHQLIIKPHIPTDIKEILERIGVTLPASGRHLYRTGHGAQWLSPYNCQFFASFPTHHNTLLTDSRMCIQYLIKYASGEEERSMSKGVPKSESEVQFTLTDKGKRKRAKITTNPTYNTRCIADTEICDNLLSKNYRETDVIAHPINIGAAEFRLSWTTEPSIKTLAAPSANKAAVYGAINNVLEKWTEVCNNDRYRACCPTADQLELYKQLTCRPPSQWGVMEHWSLRPRQLQQCPVTTWQEMFAYTPVTNEFGNHLQKPDVINKMSNWYTTAFPPLAAKPPLLLRGIRDATYRQVKFRLQALRELNDRLDTICNCKYNTL